MIPGRGVALLDRAAGQLDSSAPDAAHAWLSSLRAVTHVALGDADGERERLLLRVPRRDGRALAAALHAAQAGRSARKVADPLRVQLDPLDLV